MTRVQVPAVHAAGRTWPAGQIEAMSAGWRTALDDRLSAPPASARAIAVVLPPSAEGVALFVAATAGRVPVIALSADPQWWPAHASVFESIPIVLPPSLGLLAGEARTRGFESHVLESASLTSSARLVPLQSPGVIV